MEDRSFKAYLMSDPQHTARGEGGGRVHPSVCLGLCVFVPVQYVCLPLCLQMSYIFCLGRGCVPCRSPFVRHLSSSPLTWNHDAPQQVQCNKITVGRRGNLEAPHNIHTHRATRRHWSGRRCDQGLDRKPSPTRVNPSMLWHEEEQNQRQTGWTSAMSLMWGVNEARKAWIHTNITHYSNNNPRQRTYWTHLSDLFQHLAAERAHSDCHSSQR